MEVTDGEAGGSVYLISNFECRISDLNGHGARGNTARSWQLAAGSKSSEVGGQKSGVN